MDGMMDVSVGELLMDLQENDDGEKNGEHLKTGLPGEREYELDELLVK